MPDLPKIFPLGLGALTVDFGNEISVPINDQAIALASYFDENRFPGFIEAVPAYSSVAIYYDVVETRRRAPRFGTAFDAVSDLVYSALHERFDTVKHETRLIEIPVDFSDAAALDIGFVGERAELCRSEVIKIFTSKTYRVYMLGFLPGFAYMGDVDERIVVPRKDSPRAKVPKGSVGIAGRQTGVYPLESPGGWQIVGRTSVDMFTPNVDALCLLKPGDEVKFLQVDR